MKSRIYTLAIAATLLFAFNTAQAQKFGYVNSFEVLALMPEAQLADSLLGAMNQEMTTLYQTYIKEFQDKSAQLNSGTLSEVEVEAKTKDLTDLQQRIREFEANSQQKLEAKRQELYEPVLKKATDLLKAVAEEHGYAMIFDTSSGAVAYAPDGDNVIELVKAKLAE